MTLPEKIRESYDEVPFTYDHEDLDLAYPMVAPDPPREGIGVGNLLRLLAAWFGAWIVVILLVYGIARAIDKGNWSW